MNPKPKLVSRAVLVPFILVTSLFFAWGFANDITNPMVKAFSKIFRMSTTDGALVQLAFYGGYYDFGRRRRLFNCSENTAAQIKGKSHALLRPPIRMRRGCV